MYENIPNILLGVSKNYSTVAVKLLKFSLNKKRVLKFQLKLFYGILTSYLSLKYIRQYIFKVLFILIYI